LACPKKAAYTEIVGADKGRGKTRFVFESTLTYAFMVVGGMDVIENLFYGRHHLSLGQLVYYLLTGIPIALVGWSSMEAQYQRALNEAHAKALPNSKPMPHDDA
jgi:hypothetical protein